MLRPLFSHSFGFSASRPESGFVSALFSYSPVSVSLVTEQKRTWVRPKKRPKVGVGFHEKAQQWREEWMHHRQRQIADSLRAYVEFCTTKRTPAWDARFAPFDRDEKDGVHIITKQLVEDKLSLVNYHQRATKRLFCNVGLIGPTVTTKARWKSVSLARMPVRVTSMSVNGTRDRSHRNGWHSDP